MHNGKSRTAKDGLALEEMTPWVRSGQVKDQSAEQRVYLIDWSSYFRRDDVRQALHIPAYIPWFQYHSDEIFENYQFAIEGAGLINDVLKKYNYKMMLVFGDTDGACSVLGTRKWLKALGWKRSISRVPWLDKDEQLLGYIEEYGTYSFVTVHGKGHLAMYEKKKEVSDLITDFIKI